MTSLADDACVDDGNGDGGGGDCENDLSPFHHPYLLPIVTLWAGLEVEDRTSKTVHEAPAIT
jgi:hypothetical protein